MAFQRPFLISLRRTHPEEPWGFRLTGGRDLEPHLVQKVAPDSVAERSGLHSADEIIQVGRVNVQDLPHAVVQEVIERSRDRLELFVIREDVFQGRKGKNEPATVKAVVHSQYNSPLQLYSTENIADTLAQQTAILTDGAPDVGNDVDGYEHLTFKQKSAVFEALQEEKVRDARPVAKTRGHGSPQPQKKVPPPPPPKPKVQTQMNVGYPEPGSPGTQPRHVQREHQMFGPSVQHSTVAQQSRHFQDMAGHHPHPTATWHAAERAAPTPPVRTSSHAIQSNVAAQWQPQPQPPGKFTTSIQVSPSPTSSPSIIKKMMNAVWPPKRSTVKELPKTGFSPTVMREQGSGRRFVWPPPKAEEELNGRTTPTCRSLPQSPSAGRRLAWNPSPSPPPSRKMQFGYDSPQFPRRNKGVAWPPPQAAAKERPSPVASPKPARKLSRAEDYLKHHSLSGVPATYRPPPGTQHVEISCP